MKLQLLSLSLLLSSVTFAQSPTPVGWHTHIDVGGHYKIDYPDGWQILSKGNALVITSPGGPEERGVFGITQKAEGSTIQESIDKEFSDPEHSPDLQRAPAKLAGLPATKVWGSKKGDANIRMVEYYIQNDKHPYYILFQAPHAATATYSPIFNTMIGSMQFLHP